MGVPVNPNAIAQHYTKLEVQIYVCVRIINDKFMGSYDNMLKFVSHKLCFLKILLSANICLYNKDSTKSTGLTLQHGQVEPAHLPLKFLSI